MDRSFQLSSHLRPSSGLATCTRARRSSRRRCVMALAGASFLMTEPMDLESAVRGQQVDRETEGEAGS